MIRVILLVCILLYGCDFGLDYNSASKYCRDKYVFVDKQIEKIEVSKYITKEERGRYNELVTDPLKKCYMSAVICSIDCFNLNMSCYDSFYSTHQYCDEVIKNLPKIY